MTNKLKTFQNTKPSKLQLVRLDSLNIDFSYQRPLPPMKLKQRVDTWDDDKCSAITVMDRKGKLYVVDGQCRWKAAEALGIRTLAAKVTESKGVRHEAEVFLAIDGDVRSLSAVDRFRACAAARDALHVRAANVLAKAGFSVSPGSAAAGTLSCVTLLLTMVADSEAEALTVLQVCQAIAGAADHGVPRDFLQAIDYLHSHVEGGVQGDKLFKRLMALGFKVLISKAREEGRASGRATARSLARGMLFEINAKGTRNKFEMKEDQE